MRRLVFLLAEQVLLCFCWEGALIMQCPRCGAILRKASDSTAPTEVLYKNAKIWIL